MSIRRCRRCNSEDHNIATCPLMPCKFCSEHGHTSITCVAKLNQRKIGKQKTKLRISAIRDIR